MLELGWFYYLAVALGVAAIATLLVPELDPKERPEGYWRYLEIVTVFLGAGFAITVLIAIGVLSTAV